jgi:hypothetical protein
MNTRELTNNEALNDEALNVVAGGFYNDGGCTTTWLTDLLNRILHPQKPGGPINSK